MGSGEMTHRVVYLWLIFCIVFTPLFSTAAASSERATGVVKKSDVSKESRVALVIGNGAYESSPLANPVNDARAMASALTTSGFKVTKLENASREQMAVAIREFGDSLIGGGEGLFFFAGHGMQVKGRNYLIPTKSSIQREDEVEYNAIDANAILSKMESAHNRLNIMILDACRNNPFGRSFRSSASGLAQTFNSRG